MILSNNQSRATLWVLDTCLTVGLCPLVIILITASLSSKMYTWYSPWEERVLVGNSYTSFNWSTFCFLVACRVLVLESQTAHVSLWLVCKLVHGPQDVRSSRQLASKLLTILQLTPVPLVWIDDHQNKDAKLCKVAPLSCLPIHSIVQRILEHALPYRGTTPLFVREVSSIPVISLLHQQK